MRRLTPASMPLLLQEHQPPPVGGLLEPWQASFELRSVTPIVGGGVESGEPDKVDIVRIPSIRGALRWWWRKLYGTEDGEETFLREAELWGGVDVPQGRDPGALRSKVRLRVEILNPGKATPAGWHEPSRGMPKAFPKWSIGKLGYALFPLQRTHQERQAHSGNQRLATGSVRVGLHFRLLVELARDANAVQEQQVLASLWAWIHFGGLGARTRRGFGQLVVERLEVPKAWRGVFQPPGAPGLAPWLERFQHAAGHRQGLTNSTLLVGRKRHDATSCHEGLVELLRSFRQGIGTGRRAGKSGAGGSNWPESRLLRDLAAGKEAAEMGVPRAALGMPLEMQFKDRPHQVANASIVPLGAERWPSPLWLKVLPVGKDGYVPLILKWPETLPEGGVVSIRFKESRLGTKTRRVASAEGSRPPIEGYLSRAGGNAVEAFVAWVQGEKSFTEAGR